MYIIVASVYSRHTQRDVYPRNNIPQQIGIPLRNVCNRVNGKHEKIAQQFWIASSGLFACLEVLEMVFISRYISGMLAPGDTGSSEGSKFVG